mmetsp:Transcript_22436/g.32130  ORF Transcript_22436/g.32130 Transcript_22436/m.32130 type:complete len:716 (-) Transcript_22436:89-2236(-)
MNLRGTSALYGTQSPRVLFTGIKPNYKKELGLSFGDYVEVHNGTTNTSQEQSLACIALYPEGNATNTWRFYCVSTRSYVRRSTWKKMVTNDLIIRSLDGDARADLEALLPDPLTPGPAETLPDESQRPVDATPNENENALDPTIDADEATSDEEAPAEPSRRSARIAAGVNAPERLTLATKVHQSSWKEASKVKAINGEIMQLYEEQEALKPVKEVAKDAEVLRSHMNVVEKYLADGDHDKTKARIVVNGSTQDPAMYPNKSSPTLALHSLFTVLAFYNSLTGYLMAKVDIKGAFVQTPMEGKPIYMRMDKKLTAYVIALYPLYASFVQANGSLINLLQKAMYGCVQASSLWFKLLAKLLIGAGYVASETDPCVIRREVAGMISIILIYVDDLLIFASSEELERIRKILLDRFKSITMEIRNAVSYLGMQIEWKHPRFEVNMDFYVRKLIKEWMHLPIKQTPGGKDTFKLTDDSPPLSEAMRLTFHSMVQRILYVSKRVRTETLTVVSFLCTRVTKATEEDQKKLEHVLGYLRNAITKRLIIAGDSLMQIIAFVDAAFALHFDSKSHTGVVILIGGTVVYVSSRKQKCIAKIPTEAELVGFTDNLCLVELFHELVSFILGQKASTPIVFQDCTAVISLVTIGGGITRTKHMRAGMNLGKESVNEKRIVVRYCNTADMMADGFSKVLEGAPFQKFATFLQGGVKIAVKPTGGRWKK